MVISKRRKYSRPLFKFFKEERCSEFISESRVRQNESGRPMVMETFLNEEIPGQAGKDGQLDVLIFNDDSG